MELEVGMYVRTKEGNIEKICAIENEHIYTDEDYLSWYPSSNAISKASHNIIDLIEVGDYVNGYKVSAIYNPNGNGIVHFTLIMEYGYEIINTYIDDYSIKSIVTKEQISQMAYKIGD